MKRPNPLHLVQGPELSMTIALFASAPISLPPLVAFLEREGLNVLAFNLNKELRRNSIPETVRKGVLITSARGVLDIGEQTERVREVLDGDARLILCSPQPTSADRQTIIDCGASEIVEPESWSSEHIAIRVLSQLILEGDIQPIGLGGLRGASRQMRGLYGHIRVVAPLSDAVLIMGETGTGKELVAAEIHNQSRPLHTYLPVSCPEISRDLFGSELFGHKRGTFTGADRDRVGILVAAGKGTVFLDEIGELDTPSQVKLLRVLEERKVRPLGANELENVEARIVMATNRNLLNDSNTDAFRQDLLERIKGFTLELPPLRERKADIPLLAYHFLEKYNEERGSQMTIPTEGIDYLFRYTWPGNVRELSKVIRRVAAYAEAGYNIINLLQEAIRGDEVNNISNTIRFDPLVETWSTFQQRTKLSYFRALLAYTNGNKEAAAELANISRSQLFEIAKWLGEKPDK